MKKKVLTNTDDEVITRGILKGILKDEFINFNAKILEQVRFSIFEANENLKVYFEVMMKRHTAALTEGFAEKLSIFHDELVSHRERIEKVEDKTDHL
jgi:hypothetical protein